MVRVRVRVGTGLRVKVSMVNKVMVRGLSPSLEQPRFSCLQLGNDRKAMLEARK